MKAELLEKVILGFKIAFLLTSMWALAFNIKSVKATETIYINPDGSIDPPTAPISSLDNITYTFTDNIYDAIVVARDNIVVDGAGYILQGTGGGNGIYLQGRNHVTIQNINIKNFDWGIFLIYSSNYNTISGNNITANNMVGVAFLDSSSNNIVLGNNITDNGYGVSIASSSGNIVSGNTITGNTGPGGLASFGVYLVDSSDNIISENGISSNNGSGVVLYSSSNSTVFGNNITNNWFGIWLYDSSDSSICSNSIADNRDYGICVLTDSSDNRFYHNNFIGNSQQVHIENPLSSCAWDDGYPSGGNYWSDYEEKYPDAGEIDDSGIWDTPYVIDENNTDRYPLMTPYAALLGDLDWDRDVDEDDLWHFCEAFIDYYKIHVYNPLCDFNKNSKIDEDDLWTMCEAFIDYWKAH